MSTDKKSDKLDETNFRETAQKIIAKYVEMTLLVDALLWAQVIGFYNNALDEAANAARMRDLEEITKAVQEGVGQPTRAAKAGP
jgi:hypothetical protein